MFSIALYQWLSLESTGRVLPAAAAAGRALPETGDSTRADATPVTPQDLTRTVAENYASCREDQGRLEALQGG